MPGLVRMGGLDGFAEAVTSYICFCEDSCVLDPSRVSSHNDKPWFTAKNPVRTPAKHPDPTLTLPPP